MIDRGFQQQKRRSLYHWALILFLAGGSWNLSSCQRSPEPEPETSTEPIENRLVVADALLEQSDETGQILWKLQADEAIYSQDRQQASLTNLVGNLFEAEAVILTLQASSGEVINDGERITLTGGVLVNDVRHGTVFETETAIWEPQAQELRLTSPLQAKYPNGRLQAEDGLYLLDTQVLELTDEVEILILDPPLQFQGERLDWSITTETITSDTGFIVERYEADKITARLTAAQGEARLDLGEIVVTGNVLLNSQDPEIQFASNEATWNLDGGFVTGLGSIQLTHATEQTQFRASQARYNLTNQQAHLSGGVTGIRQNPPATLTAGQVDWNIPSAEVVASGNVVYEQANPRLKLEGNRAVGKFQQDQLIVSGSRGKPVTTVITP